MTTWMRGLGMIALVAFGYFLGASGLGRPATVEAQPPVEGLADDLALKVKAAHEAVTAAAVSLQGDQKLVPATTAVNSFAVLSGGVNALEDLESGRGVDPETFAGLYAGLAVDEVRAKLSKDEEGRLTYDGKVVKLYPISKIRLMYAERDRILGLKRGPTP